MESELVAGLIIKNRKLLLVCNIKFGITRIEPPGGKRNPSESWENALEREVMEELGVKVQPTNFLGIYNTHSPEGKFAVRMYFCKIVAGKPKVTEPDKISGFGWYTFKELGKLKKDGILVPNMCEALLDLRAYL
jgi:8-oxo-dGTP diphosphatase